LNLHEKYFYGRSLFSARDYSQAMIYADFFLKERENPSFLFFLPQNPNPSPSPSPSPTLSPPVTLFLFLPTHSLPLSLSP